MYPHTYLLVLGEQFLRKGKLDNFIWMFCGIPCHAYHCRRRRGKG